MHLCISCYAELWNWKRPRSTSSKAGTSTLSPHNVSNYTILDQWATRATHNFLDSEIARLLNQENWAASYGAETQGLRCSQAQLIQLIHFNCQFSLGRLDNVLASTFWGIIKISKGSKEKFKGGIKWKKKTQLEVIRLNSKNSSLLQVCDHRCDQQKTAHDSHLCTFISVGRTASLFFLCVFAPFAPLRTPPCILYPEAPGQSS